MENVKHNGFQFSQGENNTTFTTARYPQPRGVSSLGRLFWVDELFLLKRVKISRALPHTKWVPTIPLHSILIKGKGKSNATFRDPHLTQLKHTLLNNKGWLNKDPSTKRDPNQPHPQPRKIHRSIQSSGSEHIRYILYMTSWFKTHRLLYGAPAKPKKPHVCPRGLRALVLKLRCIKRWYAYRFNDKVFIMNRLLYGAPSTSSQIRPWHSS